MYLAETLGALDTEEDVAAHADELGLVEEAVPHAARLAGLQGPRLGPDMHNLRRLPNTLVVHQDLRQ
jgi:hypothetical protein